MKTSRYVASHNFNSFLSGIRPSYADMCSLAAPICSYLTVPIHPNSPTIISSIVSNTTNAVSLFRNDNHVRRLNASSIVHASSLHACRISASTYTHFGASGLPNPGHVLCVGLAKSHTSNDCLSYARVKCSAES